MTQRIKILGQVAVRTTDGEETTLRRRREREVLALLVAARGRPVPADRLLVDVWGDEVSGPGPVQVAVSRLRAMLDPARSGPKPVEITPAGYRLTVEPDEVDAWLFEDLVAQALSAPTPADRLVLASRASELWAGEPYAECRSASLRVAADALVELHVTAQEVRAESLLALGHPAAAARLLAPLAPDHPYREQLWALLARAQYACARQADALATLATLRTRLAEDLGVDPSSAVRSTEQAILTQHAGLTTVPAQRATHRRHVRIAGRCRAVGGVYVVAHTPVPSLRATGTMTG